MEYPLIAESHFTLHGYGSKIAISQIGSVLPPDGTGGAPLRGSRLPPVSEESKELEGSK